ncbi:hypothetical protein ACRJ4W_35135 [Streptomyces sp. GLT-R25]
MLEAVVGVVGVVVGVAGLVTSYAGHRHSVRESARVAAMAREVEERERELALEAERRAEVVQASLVQVMMRSRPSPLAEQWVGWSLQATNGSDQPVRDVALHYDGLPLPTTLTGGLLHAGESVSALLPTSDTSLGPARPSQPALGVVQFTDAAGVRWRRSATGMLEQRYESGSWDPRSPRVASVSTARDADRGATGGVRAADPCRTSGHGPGTAKAGAADTAAAPVPEAAAPVGVRRDGARRRGPGRLGGVVPHPVGHAPGAAPPEDRTTRAPAPSRGGTTRGPALPGRRNRRGAAPPNGLHHPGASTTGGSPTRRPPPPQNRTPPPKKTPAPPAP